MRLVRVWSWCNQSFLLHTKVFQPKVPARLMYSNTYSVNISNRLKKHTKNTKKMQLLSFCGGFLWTRSFTLLFRVFLLCRRSRVANLLFPVTFALVSYHFNAESKSPTNYQQTATASRKLKERIKTKRKVADELKKTLPNSRIHNNLLLLLV